MSLAQTGDHLFLDGQTLVTKPAVKKASSDPSEEKKIEKDKDKTQVQIPSCTKPFGPPLQIPSKANKIFVGGVPQEVAEPELKEYFCKFGLVTATTLLPDYETGRHRGFGFITFQDSSSAKLATEERYHKLKDKLMEVKPAHAKRETSDAPQIPRPILGGPNPCGSSRSLLGEHPWQLTMMNQALFSAYNAIQGQLMFQNATGPMMAPRPAPSALPTRYAPYSLPATVVDPLPVSGHSGRVSEYQLSQLVNLPLLTKAILEIAICSIFNYCFSFTRILTEST